MRVIHRENVVRTVWGDAEAGEVADAAYVSNEELHVLVYTMAPRGWFGSTDEIRTVFDADQLYYVLDGVFAIANPTSGEVHRLSRGEAVLVRSGSWHHGFNVGDGPVRVLELVAPGLVGERAENYARAQPPLGEARYVRWARDDDVFHVVGERDVSWALEGGVLCACYVSTERSTVTLTYLDPGQSTVLRRHDRDACAFVLEGRVSVHADRLLEVGADDALLVPAGAEYRLSSDGTARVLTLVPA